MDKKLKAGADLLTEAAYRPIRCETPVGEEQEAQEAVLSMDERLDLLKESALSVIQYPDLVTDEELIPAFATRRSGTPKYHLTEEEAEAQNVRREEAGRRELQRINDEADEVIRRTL